MNRGAPPRLLISARNVDEARLAHAAGADIVDLKEPATGALGAVPLAELRACVQALAEAGAPAGTVPVSATVGDWPAVPLAPVLQAARAVADCGVTWVKVGLDGRSGAAGAALLTALHQALPGRVVPVLLADAGIDAALLDAACALALPALMLDTAGKAGGSLLDAMGAADLQQVARRVRSAGLRLGLAGALRLADIERVRAFGPDIVGFRGAACEGGRSGPLVAARVRALRAELQRPLAHPVPDDLRLCL